MLAEAELMTHLHEHGFPVPRVDSVSDDGTELTMERLHGPVMVDAVARRPWRAGYHGRTIGTLHERLHRMPVPRSLPAAGGPPGDRIVHLDLHPLNVMLTDRGPVVIDWANAGRGSGHADVALSWLVIAAGKIDAGPVMRRIIGKVRRDLITGMLSVHDRRAIVAQLAAVARWKATDPNIDEDEAAAMMAVVAAEST